MLGKKNIINTNNSNIATFFILNTSNEKLSQEWDELECVWVCSFLTASTEEDSVSVYIFLIKCSLILIAF